jgi:general secretion pathway protein G
MWARYRKASGFTIVELLIVVVVIGILAAIVVVAYNGVTNSANDSVVKNDLKQSYSKIQQFYVVNGYLPSSQTEINQNLIATKSSYGGGINYYLYCRADNGTAAVVGRSTSGKGFAYSSAGGAIEFSSWPGDGNAQLCPAAGIPTSTSGYSITWIATNDAWVGWFTGNGS